MRFAGTDPLAGCPVLLGPAALPSRSQRRPLSGADSPLLLDTRPTRWFLALPRSHTAVRAREAAGGPIDVFARLAPWKKVCEVRAGELIDVTAQWR